MKMNIKFYKDEKVIITQTIDAKGVYREKDLFLYEKKYFDKLPMADIERFVMNDFKFDKYYRVLKSELKYDDDEYFELHLKPAE